MDHCGSITSVHKFSGFHDCVLRSIEVIQLLLHIQCRKDTQNADENRINFLDQNTLCSAFYPNRSSEGSDSIGGVRDLSDFFFFIRQNVERNGEELKRKNVVMSVSERYSWGGIGNGT